MLKQIVTISVLRRYFFEKTEFERGLILSCLFSVCLSIVRVIFTSELLFVWLQWNLFLAIIPFVITRKMSARPDWIRDNRKFIPLLLLWILFIPNSFYIITDLFYLRERPRISIWFDLALLLSFAWNGLLLGITSVREMEKMIASKFLLRNEWVFIAPVMALNSLGVYIGRYLRYNSWDIVSNPFGLANDVLYLFLHPIRHRFDWSLVLCYAVLMMLFYITIKRVSKLLA